MSVKVCVQKADNAFATVGQGVPYSSRIMDIRTVAL
jgi:hypothetical protein